MVGTLSDEKRSEIKVLSSSLKSALSQFSSVISIPLDFVLFVIYFVLVSELIMQEAAMDDKSSWLNLSITDLNSVRVAMIFFFSS